MITTLLFILIVLGLHAPPITGDMSAFIINTFEAERKAKSEYERFIDDLGFWESRNNPNAINSVGCFGEYQFKESTLNWLGYGITLNDFKKDSTEIFPEYLQREAVDKLIALNWETLIEFNGIVGDTVRGGVVSKSGLLAAAHLGGVGSVRLYLLSNGTINRRDAYGTSIADYMLKFNGYGF